MTKGRACSIHRRGKEFIQNLEDLGVAGRIVLNSQGVRVWIGLCGSGLGTSDGLLWTCTKPSGSIKDGIPWHCERLLAYKEGLCCMDIVIYEWHSETLQSIRIDQVDIDI
jgi:hypothetical protein